MACVAVWGLSPIHAASRSRLLDAGGAMRPFSERGDVIPDFSAVGYRSGERDLRPSLADLPVVDVAPGGEGRDAARIQEALELAAKYPLLGDGYRAVVRLAAGRYDLEQTIRIEHSGLVLAGVDGAAPPELHYLPAERGTALVLGKSASAKLDEAGALRVEASYVPVGERRLPVPGARERFRVGDAVMVRHAFNDDWIRELGMDRIPSNRAPGPDGELVEITRQWESKDYVYRYLRVVREVEPDALVLDAPMVQPLDRRFGETLVGHYTHDEVIERVGVRDLVFVSAYDDAVRAPNNFAGEEGATVAADERHGVWAVVVQAARQGWVHRVTAKHFVMGCVHLAGASSHFTVSECRNLDPVSRIEGGRRYSFFISGQRHLVRDCFARGGRHDFAGNSRVPGPNVFLDCTAENAYSGSEPHHRMAFGFLYDNVVVRGPGAFLAVLDRGNNGSGHGWMGAQTVFWNCAAPLIIAQKPPLYQNFAIGVRESTDRESASARRNIEGRLRMTNAKSRREFTLGDGPFVGDGHFESPDAPVQPASLYQHQLARRIQAAGTGR